MLPKLHAVIPARYASSRLPAKPLADIAGVPMVVRVAQRIESLKNSGLIASITIATDHQDIILAAQQHNVSCCLTQVNHATGTDRIAETASLLKLTDDAIVINVQGDEPLIDPSIVLAVAQTLIDQPNASIATAAHPIHDATTFFDPNVVKVVVDNRSLARYFSRAPIPYARDAFAVDKTSLPGGFKARRHIGLYAYRVGYLVQYAKLPQPDVERFESLEQLRAILSGYEIAVLDWPNAIAAGVDTPDDLARVRAVFATGQA
jgi:3-deoxy-manno-octulosonate cytidylyltransferase (CMP-KDO synthetase)